EAPLAHGARLRLPGLSLCARRLLPGGALRGERSRPDPGALLLLRATPCVPCVRALRLPRVAASGAARSPRRRAPGALGASPALGFLGIGRKEQLSAPLRGGGAREPPRQHWSGLARDRTL